MNEEGLLVEKIQQGLEINLDPKDIENEFLERLEIFIKSYK
jgi:hypothetical protein